MKQLSKYQKICANLITTGRYHLCQNRLFECFTLIKIFFVEFPIYPRRLRSLKNEEGVDIQARPPKTHTHSKRHLISFRDFYKAGNSGRMFLNEEQRDVSKTF